MKEYRRILVRRNDGTTYYRRQLVGSDKKDKPKQNSRLGRCYQLSAEYVSTHGGTLVHGILENPFSKGYRHLQHAWVIKENGQVYDPVMDVSYQKEVYYALYHAIEQSKYSKKDVIERLDKEATYGPWRKEDVMPTAKTHKEVDGRYSSGRFKIHKDIVNSIITEESRTNQGETPEVILTMGGSGSGKSTLLKGLMESLDKKYSYLDVDDIKNHIPEYKSFQKTNVEDAAFLVHEESSDIGKLALEKLSLNKHNFIFDSTLKDADWAVNLVKVLKARGYKIKVIAATVPIDVATKRCLDRAKETGRFIPENIIKQSHEKVSESFKRLIDIVEDLKLFDTNNEGINLVYEKGEVGENIYDESLFQKFNTNYKGFTKSILDILIERHPDDELLKSEKEHEKKSASSYADCIISDGDKILLLLRRKDSDFAPFTWGLPGGHIDDGETPIAACIREVKEETGLDISIEEGLVFIKEVELEQGGCIYYYAYNITGEPQVSSIVLDSEEHENYQWMTTREFMDANCIYNLQENIEDFLIEELSEEEPPLDAKKSEPDELDAFSEDELDYLLGLDIERLKKSESELVIEEIEEELVKQASLSRLESLYFNNVVKTTLEKSHKAVVGEVHEWSGKKYQKITEDTWKFVPELSHDQKTRLDEAMSKMSLDELNTLITTSKQTPIVEAARRLVDEKRLKYVRKRTNEDGYLELKSKLSKDNPFADDDEIKRYFKYYMSDVSDFSKEEISIIEDYKLAVGSRINRILRSGEESTLYKEAIEDIDNCFKKVNIKDNVILHRSVKNHKNTANFFSDLEPGDSFEDKGYVSCSIVKFGTSKFFIPDVSYELVIRVNKGSNVLPLSLIGDSEVQSETGDEYEFLLPRNSQFKVISNKDRTIELELL